ncbi:hypothetical protein VTN31DRAFT_5537 [Thermomyces dupontii]|uniref:uncharacterized protein n=1 Tax=Talaromyces thermophilus TaxID=28565 RepID=UPI003743B021
MAGGPVYAAAQSAQGGGHNGGGGGGHGGEEGPPQGMYGDYILMALAGAVALYFAWAMSLRVHAHIRRLFGLLNEKQRYFARPDHRMAWFKRNVVDAPLFRVRHNREFQLSSAINMGTLPTRFQSLVLVGLLATNAALCLHGIPFSRGMDAFASPLLSRTGILSVVNTIPLVILAGRNNPLIPLLGLSFDCWNLFHRWLGRIAAFEAAGHMAIWMAYKVHRSGWAAVGQSITHSTKIMTGFVAVCCFVGMSLLASSPLRHAFYETFLHIHIGAALTAFIFLWIHLKGSPARDYLLATLILWGAERFARLFRQVYRNLFKGRTRATVEILPGEAMRITLTLARPWRHRPGQHLYLYIPSVSWWMSHPFSVAWSQPEEVITDEKGLVMTQQDVQTLQKDTISLLVRRRTGFTDTLYKRANKAEGKRISFFAIAEGPYGGIHDLDSYGTVVLFAGGVGITHHIPFIHHLVEGYAEGLVAARRVTLVWTLQSPEHLEWIRPWIIQVLALNRRREVLRIMLFITRPRNAREVQSPSATVQMFPGRPNVGTILDMEIEQQIGTMAVLVCGTGSLSDDVRRACRQRQSISNIDFLEEAFSW